MFEDWGVWGEIIGWTYQANPDETWNSYTDVIQDLSSVH
jgi:hypothetical protein